MKDPTREELIEAAERFAAELTDEPNPFDIEGAAYWIAANYHDGQWSNLYAALSRSPFMPGPLCDGPDDGDERDIYDALEAWLDE